MNAIEHRPKHYPQCTHCQFVEQQIEEIDPVDKDAIQEVAVTCHVQPDSLKSLMQVSVHYPAGESTTIFSGAPSEVHCVGAAQAATAGQG